MQYKKAGNSAAASVLEDMMGAEIELNKLSKDKSKVSAEQLAQLQTMIKTKKEIATLDKEHRKNAQRINKILRIMTR